MSQPQKPAKTTASGKHPAAGKKNDHRNAGRTNAKGGAPMGANRRPASSAEDVKPGDRIVITIKRIGINGEGVGYYKRKAVFINGALPNEVVKADVLKAESTYITAKLVEIEKPSPDRQTPPCPVYDACGGCQLQHMTYSAQLRAKEELIREAFSRYAGMDKLPLRPIHGMDDPWGYRHKAQLQTGWHNEHILTGLYSAGTHKVVDISGCPVQHPVINEVTVKVKSLMKQLGILPYQERTRKGTVRTVVTRIAKQSGEVQLTLITATRQLTQADAFVEAVRRELPMVTTVAQNVNPADTPLVFGEETRTLWGRERLDEHLGELRFSLSPRAFFQLNPEQTVKLYDAVKEAAGLTGGELVVDAYCGTGTIGLWLAPQAKEVRGIELLPEAVEDARRNAELSGAANAQFYVGHAETLLPEWVSRGVRPDVVVVDPPRSGCERRLLTAIADAKPARLVYVSCNPSTLAKDCLVLLQSGYRLEWIQPVDMFPQTAHVESVILMVRT
ncbi:23S rRNA (uracil(1939)-C(5))-methyltransferase RlmD [Paenibacillus piri]|uniref:23S rRNA (Uracil(1939)-C(5))-methyltransferase RlmD n=1 Tax=Paenibacillus piri TaxID=2547395 RepID=A0A4R5KNQ7_9BACL|nr:23S rRNA (uracil(1939)-C(5))-methyltransferase RlmD [Paenibacillus piri]TDF96307.1 23S rRNA (uracil(1939)-C(5))-methyltransferase RlmD [Paenibacillus piri]